MNIAARFARTRQRIVYGVPFALAGACFVVGGWSYQLSPILRWLMIASGVAALFMYWAPARYVTSALITAAWLGRAVSALYGIDGYDDRTNFVVAGLWPCLWYLAMVAIFVLHRERIEDRVLGR